MNTCWDCGTTIENNRFRCDNCYGGLVEDTKRRRPLTKWEEQKLSFHRNEKWWKQSIRSRTMRKGKDGKMYPAHLTRRGKYERIYHQPKELLPEPKRR